ncbi:autophagy protein Apg6-domain-containing protein [Lasiosphaeria ovina]|uniref:Autophagy protein Apg6-domain-containing protein n=1 Tax=Lasiosphaeria ovina TaxID=92902 RepID=A0AAE0TXX1_9PEZI|nr:autophagy protein Apg6-domain-containing protein [Lasiosphaeria ovina]
MYCQKCRAPLRLDNSVEDLNPAAYDLLVATHSQQQQPLKKQAPFSSRTPILQSQERARKPVYDQAANHGSHASFKRHSGPGRGDGQLRDTSMSFILLTESQIAPPGGLAQQRNTHPQYPDGTSSLHPRGGGISGNGGGSSGGHDGPGDEDDSTKSYEMERIAKLFEILSARSDIDHPVCVECTELLLEEMQKKLELTTRERDAYVSYLKEMQAGAPTDEELQAQEQSLRAARKAETEALAELRRLEEVKASMDAELAALEDESQELDGQEETFWRERNAFASRLDDFQNERDSVNSKFDHDSRQLEKLQRSNVYNDTFCISHDGTFATINGLRLGRLSSKPVDWPEINAAWGHALLLLVTVADKLAYRFEGYEPQPMGSTSRIVRLDPASPASSRLGSGPASAPPPPPKRHVLDLFSSGDMPLGLTFMHRKFDNAMTAFLELVRQLGAHVQLQTAADGTPLALPYRIEGDKIGDVSIKLGIAQDDGWTKACKLTLTCCKFLLAHASNVSAISNGRTGA